ncbi:MULTISPECIES: type II toxin-antitoxin system RelE/ParE family toxin [Bradyrhizobium]|uniref:type II toxin-antitoxin system RelE/ParE family toxin n=1 Tax=Bradyrhizobium TaxID=374 RepID=UPI000B898228|nr:MULTISPECIES: type II toxin-antitoxin system RelE/ParE family toxin [Bradyrhizobium]MCC8975651.1 type II toxin-antitoxin system RelE/ParE family toxin [Bradyrhizobium brasilense]
MGKARAVNVRYTRRALVQIDHALSYIETRSPQGAVDVRDRILALVTLLQEQPRAGRPTSRSGVRRLSATPYPYLIDYRVTPTEIIIMRFRHAARRPIR